MALNQHQQGTFPRKNIQNPKNNGHCLSITTRSGKMTIDPPKTMIVDDAIEPVIVDDEKVANSKEIVANEPRSNKPQVDDHEAKVRKGNDNKVPTLFTPIPSPSFFTNIE